MVVMSQDTADLIRAAGGWLFDRAMSGWDVLALVGDKADRRPLRILGVRGVNMDVALALALASRVSGARPHVVAVSAEVYEVNACAQRFVLRSLDDGGDVRVWGGAGQDPGEASGEALGTVCHQLSLAARTFKAHALAAVDDGERSVDMVEVFRNGEFLRRPPGVFPAA